jgi:hypothetical protein
MNLIAKKKRLFILIAVIFIPSLSAVAQEFQVIFEDEPVAVKTDSIPTMSMLTGRDTLRSMIIDKAKQYLGVNYRYGHSDANGFDCSGYVKFVYGQFGYTLPHSSYAQYSQGKPLKKQNARPGDLVFFAIKGHKISHVGIYIGDNSFIHSPSQGRQVCIDTLDSDYYRRHLAGFRAVL